MYGKKRQYIVITLKNELVLGGFGIEEIRGKDNVTGLKEEGR